MDQLTEFEMWSPTGYWRGKFPDGPSNWHYVYIPISDLTEAGLDGSRPLSTEVKAFLWTYHSNGTRKVSGFSIWYVSPPDLKAIGVIRHTATRDLLARGIITRPGTADLFADGDLTRWEDLYANATLRQGTENLKAIGMIRQETSQNLFAKGRLYPADSEDLFAKGSVRAPVISEVDPSTEPLRNGAQRCAFYDEGRYWVFYIDSGNLVYKTSTDAENWSSATTVRALSSMLSFSLHFDGSYMHYAVTDGDLYYRRGEPQADGSITWSAVEQTAETGSLSRPSITVDSTGHAWILYYDGDLWAIKNGNTNGTWSTDVSETERISFSDVWGVIRAADAGKIIATEAIGGAFTDLHGKYYDGSSWHSDAISVESEPHAFDMAILNDDVLLVWLDPDDNDKIKFKKKTAWVYDGWGATVTVVSSGSNFSSNPTIAVDSSGNIYIFYYYNLDEKIRYVKSSDGGSTWDSPKEFSTQDLEFNSYRYGLAVFIIDDKMGIAWTHDTDGVQFGVLDLS